MTKKELRALCQQLEIETYDSPEAFLHHLYERAKEGQPQFTYSKYSELCGLSHSNALFLMIQGRRPITIKSAEKMVAALGMTGFTRRYFLQMVQCERARNSLEKGRELSKLVEMRSERMSTDKARQQLAFFEKWYHAALLEVLRLEDAQDDPKWLSEHIQPHVPPGKIKKALQLLKDLGYTVYDEDKGRYVPSHQGVSTGDEAQELAIARYHHQMLELSAQALDEVAQSNRDIGALTLAVDAKAFWALKRELWDLRKRMIALSEEAESRDQVVQVNVQLFPLMKEKPR